MHRQKEAKAGQGGRIPPCQTPLTLSCAGYEYCFSLNNREKQIRTAHRCAPKVATAYLPPPPCGARKNLCAARLLDFFDRCGCSASLHPPLAALGFAPPFPSPAAGEGPSGQIAACSTRRLGSVTSCYRFAVTQHKMRRRPLESVSSRSLSVRGSWGTAPSAFWYGPPGGTQGPLGKGGAAERWRVTPSVSGVTRHGAQPATTRAYKSRPPPGRRANYAFAKGSAPPSGEMKPRLNNIC